LIGVIFNWCNYSKHTSKKKSQKSKKKIELFRSKQ